jgi:hypothetical protein
MYVDGFVGFSGKKSGDRSLRYCFIPTEVSPYSWFACEVAARNIMNDGEALLIETFKHIQNTLDQTPHLLRIGRLFSETILIDLEGDEFYLTFEKGRIVTLSNGMSRKTPWRFALRTDSEALSKFWEPMPEAGFHDVFGLVKIGRGRVDGDILSLVKNLRFIKEVLGLGRLKKEMIQ